MTSSTIPKRSVFLGVADEISVAVERHFWLFAALFLVLFLVSAIAIDLRTKLWLDELYTVYTSRQASPREIVKATLEGCDSQPPLYAMIVHAISPWARHEALAVRLPSTLGYCGMVLFLLAFSRRRFSAVYAMVAALLACNAFLGYSTEGRSYGVVLGCAAGALLCWQTAADGRRRVLAVPLLAFFLALMTAMHYYSIFFLVPLFAAEMVRWRKSGKLDFVVLAAMTAPALLVLGLHYPLIASAKPFQEHFWSPAAWDQIPELYLSYFQKICLLPLVLLAVFSTTPGGGAKSASLTLPEWVATGAFCLMPLCVVVLSIYATHTFVPRYTFWVVPGMALLITALLWAAAPGKTALGVSMLGLLVALIAWGVLDGLRQKPVLREAEAVRQELASLPDGPEPVVVANAHVFMELSYDSAPPLRERLVYPVRRNLDLSYLGFDTDALNMSALSYRTKLHIFDYGVVITAYPRFVLAAKPGDYLIGHLLKAGFRVVPIGSFRVPWLYEVEAPTRK